MSGQWGEQRNECRPRAEVNPTLGNVNFDLSELSSRDTFLASTLPSSGLEYYMHKDRKTRSREQDRASSENDNAKPEASDESSITLVGLLH